MQKEFDEWFYGPYGGFSCRSEYFHTECEIENVETRRQLLLSWIKSAFEVGFYAGYCDRKKDEENLLSTTWED